ncbi:MAG: hypothetical protein Q7S66_03745 [bacterium]|nr:hypothetical protein [bacterium]
MLEQLIGSKTRVKLLQLFFRSPDRTFFVREMSRLVESQLNAVRRELVNLVKLGIVKQVDASTAKIDEIGTERSKYYKLDTEFLLFSEIKNLLAKSHELEEGKLVEDIKKRAGRVKFLLLSGVFVGTKDSPTDLLIVGEIKAVPTAKLIRDFEKLAGKPIRYTVMTTDEFSDRREIGDKFLYALFESKNIIAVDEFRIS